MSTNGSGGKTISKKATVNTNDPNNPHIPLTVTGRIIEMYTINPKSVKLKGNVGETIKETIHIMIHKPFAFKIQEITAKRGNNIRFQYGEVKDGDDFGYDVTVENTATKPGVYFDTLYLKTDSDKKSEIDISVIGSIREKTGPTAKKKDS